jgi:NAD-dependent deacetylase
MTDEEMPPHEPAPLPRGKKTRVAVLTGAGISAESGLSTFRGAGGLWEGYRAEEVATPEAFERDPELVWRFYNARRASLKAVDPNPAHTALTRLEAFLGDEAFTLITQNVDDLHQRAGTKAILPMHGELNKVRCTTCGATTVNLEELEELPRCPCGGLLRPHVVWFGEVPFHLDRIAHVLSASELFMVIGTSGWVYPAAGFIYQAKAAGAHTLGINIEAPSDTRLYDEFFQGKAGIVLPHLVDHWIKQ